MVNQIITINLTDNLPGTDQKIINLLQTKEGANIIKSFLKELGLKRYNYKFPGLVEEYLKTEWHQKEHKLHCATRKPDVNWQGGGPVDWR